MVASARPRANVPPAKRQKKAAKQAPAESCDEVDKWVGAPLSKSECSKRWPKRTMEKSAPLDYCPQEAQDHVARAHYKACQLFEGDKIEIGDTVQVYAEEGTITPFFVMRVDELFEDVQGTKLFQGHYFYLGIETDMAYRRKTGNSKSGGSKMEIEVPQDPRRVFLATVQDNAAYAIVQPIAAIEKRVVVHWVKPGAEPPSQEACDFWYDQQHSRAFMTFQDIVVIPPWQRRHQPDQGVPMASASPRPPHPGRTLPASGSSNEAWYDTVGANWHFGPSAREEYAKTSAVAAAIVQNSKVLHALELCAGAGGLSFLCQEGVVNDVGIIVKAQWAIDFNADACASYQINHPKSHVFCMGIDEFLMFSQLFKELCDRFPAGRASKGGKPAANAVMITDLRMRDNAKRGKDLQDKDQLLSDLKRSNCWIECCVQPFDESGRRLPASWVKEQDLPASCKKALGELVDKWRKAKRLPKQGDVDVIAGGPPCQGVSGLNRHTSKQNILKDAKNRLVKTYFGIVKHFRPSWVLTEQVLDILKNENGRYARFVIASLAGLRYQCRIGVIAAGEQGVAQGRFRCLVWGARQGVTLPAFPEPSHRVLDFKRGIKQEAKVCQVQCITPERYAAALPMVLLADVFSDLPQVHNYCFSDEQGYRCGPTNPFQRWMRRAPPPGTPSVRQRAARADVIMKGAQQEFQQALVDLAHLPAGTTAVGAELFCSKHSHFINETTTVCVQEGAAEASRRIGELSTMQGMFAETLGCLVLDQIDLARRTEAALAHGSGPTLRDHRPMMCNADDWLRMAHVPKLKGANFRQLPGVVGNPNGTACAGHSHLTPPPGKGGGCAGGGTILPRKSGNDKDNRVENYDRGGWRGTQLAGCPASTTFFPTGGLCCTRWCITFKQGKSNGRQGCFGRCWYDEVQPTVVGRAEPHNLSLVHPEQNRVLTIRENARCQGFPDYWVLCALGGAPTARQGGVVTARYQQIGNAVAPPVASALGRCLLVAAATEPSGWVVDHPVIPVPDPDMLQVYALSEERNERLYSVVHSMTEKDSRSHGAGADRRRAQAIARATIQPAAPAVAAAAKGPATGPVPKTAAKGKAQAPTRQTPGNHPGRCAWNVMAGEGTSLGAAEEEEEEEAEWESAESDEVETDGGSSYDETEGSE